MPEAKNIVYDHKELAEILVKDQDIHEGLWGLYIEFGIRGANVSTDQSGKSFLPAAIVPVMKIGIQRFDKSSSLTVDASVVNPAKKKKSSKS
jgi:hypothetical protein